MPSPAPERSDRLELRGAAGCAAAGVLLTAAAVTFGATPLLVAGIAFIVLGLLTPAWVASIAAGASVHRDPLPSRLIEGRRLEVTIELRGSRLLGLPGAVLHDPLAPHAFTLAEVRRDREPGGRWRGAPLRLQVRSTVQGRGRLLVPQPWLTVSDPLGLARVTRRGDGPAAELLVLPRTEAVQWAPGLGPVNRSANRGGQEPLREGELDGVRSYREGTPATRIYWPALARGAGLQERQLIDALRSQPVVVVDPRIGRTGAESEALLDAAVRAAASITLALARAGGVTLVLPDSRRPLPVQPNLTGWAQAHTALALLRAAAPEEAAPVLPRDGEGPLVYVAAVAPAGVRWRGELVVITPIGEEADGQAPAILEVSSCRGRTIHAARGEGRLTTRRRRPVGPVRSGG
jgi:uncharacterized protein (DUF58 family)